MQENECPICYEPFAEWILVTECTHHCCLRCGLRYKFISNKSGCPICLKETPGEEMLFEMHRLLLAPAETFRFSKDHSEMYLWGGGIWAPPEEVPVIEHVLGRTCQMCPAEMYDAESLVKHYTSAHGRFLCRLCVQHRCEFPSEYRVYTDKELAAHHRGEGEQSDHPLCRFCRERFYCQNMFTKHNRRTHELCYLCEKLGKKDQYYRNYQELEAHFKHKHFTCTHQKCIETKCYAFIDQLALTLHLQKHHPAPKEPSFPLKAVAPGKKAAGGKKGSERARVESEVPREVPEHMKRDALAQKRDFLGKYSALIKAHYPCPEMLVSLTSQYNDDALSLSAYVEEVKLLVGGATAIEVVERIAPYLTDLKKADVAQNFPALRRAIEFAPIPARAPAHVPAQSSASAAPAPPKPAGSSSKSIWEHFGAKKFASAPSLSSKLPKKAPNSK
ncbi:E3 ubiquitin-protein ligase [Nematocida sp. AWRm77]|nr:E3 ubiquitin-protein ligase [Nematocida sp. AWRm77]